MSKLVKELEMQALRRRFAGVSDLLVVNVIGLDAADSNKLRLELRKKGIELQVVKNSLAKKVMEGTPAAAAAPILDGPSAVAWGGEGIVELAREISDWARKIEKLQIKGGCVGGTTLDARGVETLSKLPSRLELLGRIVAQIQSPGANLAARILGPGGMLASQIKQKSEGEAEAAPAA